MKKRLTKHNGTTCVGPTIKRTLTEVLKNKLKEDSLTQKKTLFNILSGKTRFKVLYLLTIEEELCVCDLADIIETTVSAVSHQLNILRKNNLVKTRKDIKTVYYSLTQETKNILACYMEE